MRRAADRFRVGDRVRRAVGDRTHRARRNRARIVVALRAEETARVEAARRHRRFVRLANRVAPRTDVVRFRDVADPARRLFRVPVRRAEEVLEGSVVRLVGVVLRVRNALRNNVVVERRLFRVRHQPEQVARVVVANDRTAAARRRERVMRVVVHLARQLQLFQLVRALHATGRFARRLDRREKKPDQNPDDRDDDQQLDESEAAFVRFGNAHFTYFPQFSRFLRNR